MRNSIITQPVPFLTKERKTHLTVQLIIKSQHDDWLKKQSKEIQAQAKAAGFGPSGKRILIVSGKKTEIFAHVSDDIQYYDVAAIADDINKAFSGEFLKSASFTLKGSKLKGAALERAHIGWGWGCYKFDSYKSKSQDSAPMLVYSDGVDKKRVKTFVESVNLIRDMVNTPANDLGPEEIAATVQKLAQQYKVTATVTKGKPLEKDFPLIHMVGDSSPRRPCLIDLRWGNPKHPKLTLIGKGVCFDTGGLDLKPSAYMKHMKKDMGGAAHALALANMVMALNLPVSLRLLIPAVENAVSGDSFRPGDIVKSRKGLFVENTNTDAEGRLILADTLTYASEEKTDLIIDFATLTGSARAGLGHDIPAFFATDDKTAEKLQKLAFDHEDPVWRMPLWAPYKKHIESANADLLNSSGIPGDLIYSALFLQSFLKDDPEWIHLDVFAWEFSGRPGRAKNGADTGMRAVFAMLEDRYGR